MLGGITWAGVDKTKLGGGACHIVLHVGDRVGWDHLGGDACHVLGGIAWAGFHALGGRVGSLGRGRLLRWWVTMKVPKAAFLRSVQNVGLCTSDPAARTRTVQTSQEGRTSQPFYCWSRKSALRSSHCKSKSGSVFFNLSSFNRKTFRCGGPLQNKLTHISGPVSLRLELLPEPRCRGYLRQRPRGGANLPRAVPAGVPPGEGRAARAARAFVLTQMWFSFRFALKTTSKMAPSNRTNAPKPNRKRTVGNWGSGTQPKLG